MVMALPFIFEELGSIFRNAPYYTLCLQAFLLVAVVWLIFYKRNGRKYIYTKEEEEEIIANYTPEPLVSDVPADHPALKPRIIDGRVGKRINIDGHDCLNLATHNYLGFLDDTDILEDAVKTLRKYGVGSCGPRGFYGTIDVHLDLEDRLASFMGMEEAVVYSYGFSTIASAIPAYSKRNDVIFVDEQANFAIQKGLDASRSTIYYFKHNDPKDLERVLIEQKKRDDQNPKKAAKTRRFLVLEGIYINTGNICRLPEMVALRHKYQLRLFLDESVSFGTLGKTGRGVTEHFNVDTKEVDLISAGMEGSMSTVGGFCVGSHFIVEHQRLSGLGYCFSASLPPLLTKAAIRALDRFEEDAGIFEQLKTVSTKLHSKFQKLSAFKVIGDELSPVKHLYLKGEYSVDEQKNIIAQIVDRSIKHGLAVIDAQYLYSIEKISPVPSIRITCNRLLTESDIEHSFDILESISKMPLC